ncbi:MAG: hypothetical protein ACF8R9_13270 [Phycisphaerales bacterium JB054]
MARHIVHVIDPAGPASSAGAVCERDAAADIALLACAEAVRATPADRHTVVIVGTEAAARHAAELALGSTDAARCRAPAILGHGALGFRSLRARLRTLDPIDVLQPWSRRSHKACSLAAGPRIPTAPVAAGTLPSFTPPAHDAAADTRERLGVPDDLPLVALLCDPTHHADPKRFVYMVGTLQVAGYPVAGLVDRRAGHTARARRFHAESGVAWRVLMPSDPTASLLHACDMAVVLPPPVHQPLREHQAAWVRWSVLRAHLLGVPVIGAGEWLPDEMFGTDALGGAELFQPWNGSLRDMLRRLISLAEDPAHRRRVADAAQGAAAGVATSARYADDLDRLWHAAASRPNRAPRTLPA